MKNCILIIAIAMGFLASCTTYNPNGQTEKTQLQIREYQTRSYENIEQLQAMKAVANALQDDGFIIKDAEVALGIISAGKEVDVESGWDAFFSALAYGAQA